MGFSFVFKDVTVQKQFRSLTCDMCKFIETSPHDSDTEVGYNWERDTLQKWSRISLSCGPSKTRAEALICNKCVAKTYTFLGIKP